MAVSSVFLCFGGFLHVFACFSALGMPLGALGALLGSLRTLLGALGTFLGPPDRYDKHRCWLIDLYGAFELAFGDS